MVELTSAEFQQMPSEMATYDAFYLPLPNRIDVVISDAIAPSALNPTAFVLAFNRSGDLLLANNRRCGLEVPGGHIDPGETSIACAKREAYEEVGTVLSVIKPVGFFRVFVTNG